MFFNSLTFMPIILDSESIVKAGSDSEGHTSEPMEECPSLTGKGVIIWGKAIEYHKLMTEIVYINLPGLPFLFVHTRHDVLI